MMLTRRDAHARAPLVSIFSPDARARPYAAAARAAQCALDRAFERYFRRCLQRS